MLIRNKRISAYMVMSPFGSNNSFLKALIIARHIVVESKVVLVLGLIGLRSIVPPLFFGIFYGPSYFPSPFFYPKLIEECGKTPLNVNSLKNWPLTLNFIFAGDVPKTTVWQLFAPMMSWVLIQGSVSSNKLFCSE